MLIVDRLMAAILPDETQGEVPLLPILNRYKPVGTSAAVDFFTTRTCHGTQRSQVNLVVLDTTDDGNVLLAFTWRHPKLSNAMSVTIISV